MTRLRTTLGWAITVVICLSALMSLIPDIGGLMSDSLRLSARYPWAQALALRSALATGFGLLGLVFLVSAISRVLRHVGGTRTAIIGMVCVLVAAGHTVTMMQRGVHNVAALPADSGYTTAEMGDASITIVELNTQNSGADVVSLALTCREAGADIIVLPETTPRYALRLADLLTQDGYSLDVFSAIDGQDPIPAQDADFDDAASFRITSVLVSRTLGVYDSQPTPTAMGFGSMMLTATPHDDAQGPIPTIAAVHTYPPLMHGSHQWVDSVQSATDLCRNDPPEGLIVVGDFNATIDHAMMHDLGQCDDGAVRGRIGGLATWPTTTHTPVLGAPIDHVLVDVRVWSVTGARLADIGGTDHRALIVRISPIVQ